jgi:hypothetical protein
MVEMVKYVKGAICWGESKNFSLIRAFALTVISISSFAQTFSEFKFTAAEVGVKTLPA